ncbi:MAG: tyrosine-type recombinase/integrase [Candidatus Moduliflexus flocculans]|nr:tyrosine-type recombinase/integrase [Candidatus Moduliflexus flocculans]
MDKADPRWCRPAIIVWLNTGLRKMELLKLKREDVNFKKMALTVIARNAKNGKARTIPINTLVAETLRTLPGETYSRTLGPGPMS